MRARPPCVPGDAAGAPHVHSPQARLPAGPADVPPLPRLLNPPIRRAAETALTWLEQLENFCVEKKSHSTTHTFSRGLGCLLLELELKWVQATATQCHA